MPLCLYSTQHAGPTKLYLDESGTLGYSGEVFTMAIVLVRDLPALETCIAKHRVTQTESKASQMRTAQKLALARTILEENQISVFLADLDPRAALVSERKLDKDLLYDSMAGQALAYYLQRSDLQQGLAYRLSMDIRGSLRESYEDLVRDSIGNVLMNRESPLVSDIDVRFLDSKFSAGVQAADLFSNVYRTALSQKDSPCQGFLRKYIEEGVVHAGFVFGLPQLADQMTQIANNLHAMVEMEPEAPRRASLFEADAADKGGNAAEGRGGSDEGAGQAGKAADGTDAGASETGRRSRRGPRGRGGRRSAGQATQAEKVTEASTDVAEPQIEVEAHGDPATGQPGMTGNARTDASAAEPPATQAHANESSHIEGNDEETQAKRVTRRRRSRSGRITHKTPEEKAAEVQTAEVGKNTDATAGDHKATGTAQDAGTQVSPALSAPEATPPAARDAAPDETPAIDTHAAGRSDAAGRPGVAADEVAPADSAASTADKPVDVRPGRAARSQQAASRSRRATRTHKTGEETPMAEAKAEAPTGISPEAPKAPETPESSGTPAAIDATAAPKEPSMTQAAGVHADPADAMPAAKDTATGIAVGPEGVGSIPGSDDGAAASHKRRGTTRSRRTQTRASSTRKKQATVESDAKEADAAESTTARAADAGHVGDEGSASSAEAPKAQTASTSAPADDAQGEADAGAKPAAKRTRRRSTRKPKDEQAAEAAPGKHASPEPTA